MGGRIISVQNIRLALPKQNKSMISNKRGAYILEACIVFPPFIIAIIMLLSLIPVMAEWENAVYSACDELRFCSLLNCIATILCTKSAADP